LTANEFHHYFEIKIFTSNGGDCGGGGSGGAATCEFKIPVCDCDVLYSRDENDPLKCVSDSDKECKQPNADTGFEGDFSQCGSVPADKAAEVYRCTDDNKCKLNSKRCATSDDCTKASKPVCDATFTCVAGTGDPCETASCGSNGTCNESTGECSCTGDYEPSSNKKSCVLKSTGDCDPACGSDETCQSGTCVPNTSDNFCTGITCESWTTCNESTGECELKSPAASLVFTASIHVNRDSIKGVLTLFFP